MRSEITLYLSSRNLLAPSAVLSTSGFYLIPVGSATRISSQLVDPMGTPRWYLVNNGKACGGIAVRDGQVVDACLYFRFLVGKPWNVPDWWMVEEVGDSP